MSATAPVDTPAVRVEPPAAPRPRAVVSGLRVVSACTLASRVLGLVRDVGMASLFGAGPVMDAFSVAFRIPNLFRRLFGEGALTAAFLPIFVRETNQSGPAAGWKLATAVLSVLTVVLCGLTLVGELILGAVAWFVPLGPEARLLVGLTAAMLPYVILICLAAQLSAMLNALDSFAWPALVPVLMNLIWIGGMVFVAPRFADLTAQAYVVAACILLAGVFQVVAQWPVLRACGCRLDFDWAWAKSRVGEVTVAMIPVVLGLTVAQVNTLADSLVAWGLSPGANDPATIPRLGVAWPISPGAASALYFGQRLYQFPLGVFGVALSTVMFPLFARHAEAGRLDKLRNDLTLGLRLVFVVGFPASAGLMLLSEPITALFFRHGAFDAAALRQTASVVSAYACAVWAWCGLLIVTRASYAAGDRRTPLRLSIAAVVVNLVLLAMLVWPFGGTGLALGTSLTAILQFLAATWLLQDCTGRLDWKQLAQSMLKCATATIVMTLAGSGTLSLLPTGDNFTRALVRVSVPILSAVATYALMVRLLRIDEARLLLGTPHEKES